MPTSRKLKKIGIDEHEQNGVIEPNREAKRFPNNLFLLIQYLTLFCDIKLLIKPMAAIIKNSSSSIFTESYKKKLTAAPSLESGLNPKRE
jgi:hypothetical protein